MEIVRAEGGHLVKHGTVFYNLNAVISVGYRVNSIRATQFRQCRSQYKCYGWIKEGSNYRVKFGSSTLRGQGCQSQTSVLIDTILAAGGNDLLQNPGTVSAEQAKQHAETEFEKYRIIQDRLFQSDFDRFLGELPYIEDDN